MGFFKPTKWKFYITVLFILLDFMIYSLIEQQGAGLNAVYPAVFNLSYFISSFLYSIITWLFHYEPPDITGYITFAIGGIIEGYLVSCILVFIASKLKV